MIDINTIIQQALEKAITDAVNEKFDDLACRIEGVNGRLNNHVNASVQSAPNLGQMRAQFAEDIEQVRAHIDNVQGAVDGLNSRVVQKAHSVEQDIAALRETLSSMQERFALKDVVEDDISVLKTALDDRDQDIQDLRNAFRKFKDNGPELDSQEVADVIADLFSDGTLTITIDKV